MMKHNCSIWMLLARSTVRKLVGLLLLMTVLESGAFALALSPARPLVETFQAAHIPLIATVIFGLWMLTLMLPSLAQGGYLLERLPVKPRTIFYTHAAYNVLALMVLWGMQAILILALSFWYGAQADEAMFSVHTTVWLFYLDPFAHGILPMADWTRWLRELALCIGLGIVAAYPNTRRGEKIFPFAVVAVASLLAVLTFSYEMCNLTPDLLIGGISLFTGFCILISAPSTYLSRSMSETANEEDDHEEV